MGSEEKSAAFETVPMEGGEGPCSCTGNSSYQDSEVERTKSMINEGIANKLDIHQLLSPSSRKFNIAELGRLRRPTTFTAVENIIESVKLKYKSDELDTNLLEFQVFFNDSTTNDFNTLFNSLPLEKQYYAAGVPGSFHGRLFPTASLHFIHCSYALEWLSQVPKEVVDKDSPSWNKGKIYYSMDAPNAILDAYRSQFAKDVEVFLSARAIELVPGGLMAIFLPSSSAGFSRGLISLCEFVGSALMDMAHLGLISEERVDGFNIPIHNPTLEEFERLIGSNGYFSIEKLETITIPRTLIPTPEAISMRLKAGFERLIGPHFGYEIIDQLFDRVKQKLAESRSLSDSLSRKRAIFVLLKRI